MLVLFFIALFSTVSLQGAARREAACSSRMSKFKEAAKSIINDRKRRGAPSTLTDSEKALVAQVKGKRKEEALAIAKKRLNEQELTSWAGEGAPRPPERGKPPRINVKPGALSDPFADSEEEGGAPALPPAKSGSFSFKGRIPDTDESGSPTSGSSLWSNNDLSSGRSSGASSGGASPPAMEELCARTRWKEEQRAREREEQFPSHGRGL